MGMVVMGNSRTFIFTGGGTGGHVTPALALAEGVRQNHPDAHFAYVGVRGKAEESMVNKAWADEAAATSSGSDKTASGGGADGRGRPCG